MRFSRVLLGLSFLCGVAPSFADITLSGTSSKVKSCDDFASVELNDPWDMSNSADINNYFHDVDVSGFTSPGISNGTFHGVVSGSGARLYLFSPAACGAHPVGGRFGQDLSLDVSKYNRFTIRMYASKRDTVGGIRFIWDRSCNYSSTRSITSSSAIDVQQGWHTYTIDLTALTIDGSTDQRPWSSGSITGFAVMPTVQDGTDLYIDYMRLEDANSCSGLSTSLPLSATASGNDNYYSAYLVKADQTNPFVYGYNRQFRTSATPSGSAPLTLTDTIGLDPGEYKVVGVLDSDYATLELSNPWDMDDETDFSTISVPAANRSFANGRFTGSTTGGGQLYLSMDSAGFNASKYRYLTIKGTLPGTPVLYYQSNGATHALTVEPTYSQGGVYQVDMVNPASPSQPSNSWSGTITNLVFALPAGSFDIDFISLRAAGYDTARSAATIPLSTSSYTVTVNSPPLLDFEKPNEKGGEAVRPWNMQNGDVVIVSNLTGATDPAHPAESFTTFLPDVRYVDGLRGDFFKGTNSEGFDDPVNYIAFPFYVANPIAFSGDDYRNLCFKLFVDRQFNLGDGSVGRVISKRTGVGFETSEDIALISDGWAGSSWYEYCMDMKTVPTDGTNSAAWDGTIEALRVDAHEFKAQTSYYFDYVKVRKDNAAPGHYNVVFKVSDSDDTAVPVKFFASTSATSYNAAAPFATVLSNASTRVVDWNTSALAAGTYYLHAEADDGVNPKTVRHNVARVVVDGTSAPGTDPVLAVAEPTDGAAVCDALQVKGYALQTDRYEELSAVEVKVNGVLFATIHPAEYSPAAVLAYPQADSSNVGFNQLLSASSIALGANTVTITAYSTHGPSTTVSRSIVKQASGCSDPTTDTPPQGSPVTVDVGTPTPTPAPPSNSVKINVARHDRKNLATIVVGGIKTSNLDCTLAVHGRTKKGASPVVLNSKTVSSANVTAGTATFTAKNLKVAKKAPKSVLISAQLTCSGAALRESSTKALSLNKGASGAKSALSVLSLLKKIRATAASR